MKWGLEPFILEYITDILQKFPEIRSATLFGSRVKGTYKNYSDIDIAIHAPDMKDVDFARLYFEIQETPIVFKLDVVHFDALGDTAFKAKITSEEKQFYPTVED